MKLRSKKPTPLGRWKEHETHGTRLRSCVYQRDEVFIEFGFDGRNAEFSLSKEEAASLVIELLGFLNDKWGES